MDRFSNKQFEKQTIYEIFRACRLCGAGGGYKMPIIQNVVDLDDTDVELKQKIRECVQVEVHSDDKMPPLICELCIDKINDFYEFLEMCRQTNDRTRQRLGLPPQKAAGVKSEPEEDNCILGVTEPIRDEDSEDEPLSRQPPKKTKAASKPKKTPEIVIRKCNVKIETSSAIAAKIKPAPTSMQKVVNKAKDVKVRAKRSPTPPPTKRITRQQEDDKKSIKSKNDKNKNSERDTRSTPKGILKNSSKKEVEMDDLHELLTPRKKRPSEPIKTPPSKKVKITPPPKPRAPSPKPSIVCTICSISQKGSLSMSNHMRSHTPNFTNPKLACNACGEWFASNEEANSHHKRHRNSNPYRCERCYNTYKLYAAFNDHFEREPCELYEEVPDIKCDECWFDFATQYLYLQHKCPGQDGRRGGKCSKCQKSFTLMKNLVKHESTCTYRRKGEVYIEPSIQKNLRKFDIRVAKCDPLLKTPSNGHYDVALVPSTYGLDPSRVYPYIRIKRELKDSMVNIHYNAVDYVHWDSDYSSDCSDTINKPKSRKIDSLSTLCLKVIFSRRCLGKIPRKRRIKPLVKDEDAFDTMVNTEGDTSFKRDIDSIIAGLDNAWDDADDNIEGGQEDTASLSILDNSDKSQDDENKKDETEKDESSVLNYTKSRGDDDDTDMSQDAIGDDCNKSKDAEVSQNVEKDSVVKQVEPDEEISEDPTVKEVCQSPTFTQNIEAVERTESPTYTQDLDGISQKDDETEKINSHQDKDDKKSDSNGDESTVNDVNSNSEKNVDTKQEVNKKELNICETIENDSTKRSVDPDTVSTENDSSLKNNSSTASIEPKNAISSEVSDKPSEDNSSLVGKVQENGVNSVKKWNTEVYDKELMEALDAQITANDKDSGISKLATDSSVQKERIGDEKATTLQRNSADLDNISDEDFNFDV